MVRMLGRGGMGSVHQVVDETSGRTLALKRLHAEGLNDTRVSLFEREYQTLASLQHPRIVRVFDYGVDAEGAFYTMELLEGEDLSSVAPLPWRETCLCLRDVASILGVLHARRLVHRDLSPRNLWRTPDGRLKLLDFGALAPFGRTVEVVGTPPLTAPEVLHGQDLDARTDLFALGALGYWLLTSTHAFPAREMAALQGLWTQEPTAPSRLVELIRSSDRNKRDPDERVPEALDDLLLSLLRIDAAERPRSTVDVVDSLNAIADLAHEAQEVVQSGYLDSTAFVGRRRERTRFEAALARAHNGKPGILSFEGPEGIGRSRLLSELSLIARLSGATVLALDASLGDRPYGLAGTLGRALLTALPEAARVTAEPMKATLAACGPELAEALGEPAEPDADRPPAQLRADRLDALSRWVRSLTSDYTLAIFVDDLHRVDEESQSLLAMLAHAGREGRLLLVASTPNENVAEGLTAHGAFRQAARCLLLRPLGEEETLELLRSTFGDAPNLQRTSARLHELTGGVPSGILTLARHLVHVGAVQYREGAWLLPTDLPEGLPTTRRAGALSALQQLTPKVHALAADLSAPDYAPLSLEMCRALPGVSEEALQAGLETLLELDLVKDGADGVEIAHPAVREHLYAGLEPSRRQQVHRAFARALMPTGGELNMFRQVRIGMHLLRAGDTKEAEKHLVSALRLGMAGDFLGMRRAAAAFEDWYHALDAEGAGNLRRTPALVALSASGYIVHQSYAKRFGEQTRTVLEGLLQLRLARTLRLLLGGKLSLVVALAVAGLSLRVRGAPFTLQELLRWFMTVISSIVGSFAAAVDAPAVRAYARAVAPFRALGDDNVAGLIPLFMHGLVGAVEDRPTDSLRTMQHVIDRLAMDEPVKGLEGDSRSFIRAGALYTNGVRHNLANRKTPLEIADEIEKVGPLQALTAEFLRAANHAVFGRLNEAHNARQRLELLAIQIGSGWQAEYLAPTQDLRTAFWTWDAVAAKRAAQDVALLAKRAPSIGFYDRGARACYALIRGRYERARDLILENAIEPLSVAGWAVQRAILAAAHNGLGDHDRALEVCEDALGRVAPEDLDYVQLFLHLRVEHAAALHGLGETQRATAIIDGFLEEYADRGPLAVGYLHRVRARMALEQDDFPTCEKHVEAMAELLVPLQIPSLRAVVSGARRALIQRRDPNGDAPLAELLSDDAHLMTRVQLVLTHAGEQPVERTAAGLHLAVQLAGATSGFILCPDTEAAAAVEGDVPDSELLLWAREQLAASRDDDETVTDDGDDDLDEGESGVIEMGGQCHRLTMLWHPGVEHPVAALVLSSERGPTTYPPDGVRRVLAAHLWETRTETLPSDQL